MKPQMISRVARFGRVLAVALPIWASTFQPLLAQPQDFLTQEKKAEAARIIPEGRWNISGWNARYCVMLPVGWRGTLSNPISQQPSVSMDSRISWRGLDTYVDDTCRFDIDLKIQDSNRLTFSLYNGRKWMAQKDTVCWVKSWKVDGRTATAFFENPADTAFGRGYLAMVDEINALIPEKWQVREVRMHHQQISRGIFDARYGMELLGNTIVGAADNTAWSDMPQSAFHETAHAYFQYVDDQTRIVGSERFRKNYDALVDAYDSALTQAGTSSYLVVVEGYMPDTARQLGFCKLFREAEYTKLDGGHPHDNPSELFASASAVLKFWPREFLARLKRLKKEEPRQAEWAQEAARAVLGLYEGRIEFDLQLYKKLGIRAPKKK